MLPIHYKIEKQWCKGDDFYGYKIYKKQGLFWDYKFYTCGTKGYKDALKWIEDDKKGAKPEVVYNE